ncbi:hypothetical protein [Streptomyces sp. MBT27]|uniref:hypothetical protein n=1 Tax=Streptomyces sp. MBT27 TaxID=1488356 RepID=UPI0014242898|nr:hypothetical protein [Streptomyces sp. MBT27]
MKPIVEKALEEWKEALDLTQERAVNALRLALPGLGPSAKPHYCCPVTLTIDKPNESGEGRVCVDDDARITVSLEEVPNAVIAGAVEAVFGTSLFDGANGSLEEAEPGTYAYDDEMTSAEYEVTLGDVDTGRLYVAYVPVPDAVALLDAMATAREEYDQEQVAADGTSGR